MLVRVLHEVCHAPVDWRTEERYAASGVVEGCYALQLVKEPDVRRLVEELRLGIDLARMSSTPSHGR